MSIWIRTLLVSALYALALSGCAGAPEKPNTEAAQPAESQAGEAPAPATPGSSPTTPVDTVLTTDQQQAQPAPPTTAGPIPAPPQSPQAAPAAPQGRGGMQLSFVETDIATVVQSVLGDALGQEYVIDPRVKGTITLQSTGSVSREDLFAALEVALRIQDVAMIPSDRGYRIVPIRDAPRQASVRTPESRGLPGYGIEVVPLRYAAPAEIEKVLQPIAAPGSVLRVDEVRNLLLIAGTTQERAALIDVIKIFDTDQMGGMSFSWYQLENVEAKVLASELNEVLGNLRSPLASVVRIIPMPRLDAILAASTQPQYLEQLKTWIKRLDVPSTSAERRIYVYDVQNGKAGDLAESLREVLLGSSGGTDAGSAGSAQPRPTGARSGGEPEGLGGGWQAGGVRVVTSDENNSLLVLARPSEYSIVEGALRKLDVPPRQVLIEATLAEVTLNDQLRFGIQWSTLFDGGTATLSTSSSGGILSQFPGFSYVYQGSARTDAVLNALETITNVKVVSSPKLLVLNNHDAMLQVGDSVPIATQSSVSVTDPDAPIVNTVQMRDTGVILRITPRVNKGGLVTIEVSQEISDVIPTTTSGIDSPTIQQRRLTSTVAVYNGQTIALGGLIRETKNDNRSGLPWIQRIPLLGRLFGSSDVGTRRTELIMMLTPRVVPDLSNTKELSDYLRGQFENIKPAIK
jgi:general secretion pathway protein D